MSFDFTAKYAASVGEDAPGEVSSECFAPLFTRSKDEYAGLGVLSSFVKAFLDESAAFSAKWKAVREQVIADGFDGPGAVDGETYNRVGLGQTPETDCSAGEVLDWATRWLEICAQLTKSGRWHVLLGNIGSQLHTNPDGTREWRVVEYRVESYRAGLVGGLEDLASMARYAVEHEVRIVVWAGPG